MSTRSVLTIGYAKRALEPDSREQVRLRELGTQLPRCAMIVFTKASDHLPTEYHRENFSIYGTNSKSKLQMLFDAYRLGRRILQAHQEERWVVSAQDPFETSFIAWPLSWFKNTTFQVQLHGDSFGNPAWRTSNVFNTVRFYFGQFVLKRASQIRVVSKRIKQAVTALGVAESKIQVLPVQVDLSLFLRVGDVRTSVRTSPVRFLYVGRFAPEKQLPKLIEAFAALATSETAITLTLLGDGPQKDALEKQVHELGIEKQVIFLPWTNDVPGVMAEHDVFVLTSAHEGYALVLLEAMAAGLPVITTDVGCVGEIVHDAQQGLVLPSDAALWPKTFSTVLDVSLRTRLGHAGVATARALQAEQADYPEKWQAAFGAKV